MDPRARVCAVCGRPAEHYSDHGWLHLADTITGTADHPVVPVEPGEVHLAAVCDFCYEPEPGFCLPVRDFLFGGMVATTDMPDGNKARNESLGNWAACGVCAKLIERNDWNGLIRRVLASYAERRGYEPSAALRDELRRQYRALRKNIIGAVRPAVWPQPPARS